MLEILFTYNKVTTVFQKYLWKCAVDPLTVPLPARRAGVGLMFLPVSCVRSFVRSFETLWFPDSHSWTKPHRILPFGTMIDPTETLLGIVRQVSSSIFDLVRTYFLSLELVCGISFLNQTTLDLAFWHNDRSYQALAWDCSSTSLTYIWLGYNLFCVIGIGFRTLISEWNNLASWYLCTWQFYQHLTWECSPTSFT